MTESVELDHSSVHSLNCGSDFKEVQCIPQQSIAKLNRNDLEDLYYQLHDENIEIKKKFNTLDNKYKIMATRVMRLSRDHKCIDSIEREEDQRQLQNLRQNEAALRAKLTVLRGQLSSHTRLHSAALSKMQMPKSHRCSRSCHTGHSGCGGDDESVLEGSRLGSQNHNQSRHRSLSQSESQRGGGGIGTSQVLKEQSEMIKTNAVLREEVARLQEGLNVLQKEMLRSTEQSQTRIQELETELEKYLAQETDENVELIKAKRMIKQQESTIISLKQENQMMQKEIHAFKAALSLAARDQDELCSSLMKERQRSNDLQQEVVKLSQNFSSMRELEEQLIDAKRENAVLKEHSNRLLQLTTGNTDVHSSPRSDSNDSQTKQSIVSNMGNQDPTRISEENSLIEQKIEELRKKQCDLQQELKSAQDEILILNQKIIATKEECKTLSNKYLKVQNECSKLQSDLSESNKDRNKLTQQLSDVQNECARLSDEVSKSKSELEQLQQQQQHFQQAVQGRVVTSSVKDKNGFDPTLGSASRLSSTGPPMLSYPHFYTPQVSARTNHFLSSSQSHSHPSTPRPRVGDACLALLEQTAIRPSSTSFPGALGLQGSLQERFLELCSSSSPVPASTPIPPASADDKANSSQIVPNVVLNMSEDTLRTHIGEESNPSPRPRHSVHSPQPSGVNNTQWELDKCRDLLRVQVNLNSIYKKEVASLSNIVQSLTSGNQDASKKET